MNCHRSMVTQPIEPLGRTHLALEPEVCAGLFLAEEVDTSQVP